VERERAYADRHHNDDQRQRRPVARAGAAPEPKRGGGSDQERHVGQRVGGLRPKRRISALTVPIDRCPPVHPPLPPRLPIIFVVDDLTVVRGPPKAATPVHSPRSMASEFRA